MRAQFSKLGVLREGAKRPMRSQSKNWGWGKHLQCPFGVQRLSIYTTRREAPSLRMGWMGWMDGISKVSFNVLHSLWVYRTFIYLLICIFKKLSPTFVWVSKFDVKLGVGEHHFRNYPMYVFTDGMGWDGWTEYQKCPSMFFILCRYIEHVYIYLYR